MEEKKEEKIEKEEEKVEVALPIIHLI